MTIIITLTVTLTTAITITLPTTLTVTLTTALTVTLTTAITTVCTKQHSTLTLRTVFYKASCTLQVTLSVFVKRFLFFVPETYMVATLIKGKEMDMTKQNDIATCHHSSP